MSSLTQETNREKLVSVLENLIKLTKQEKLEDNEVENLLSLLTKDENIEKEILESLFLGNFVKFHMNESSVGNVESRVEICEE